MSRFSCWVAEDNYAEILKVYNQKSMLPGSNVSQLCGLNGSKDAYVSCIISILRRDTSASRRIRRAITACFGLIPDDNK